MIDNAKLKEWTGLARRDDWHTAFVGSDIRQMLGEITRLREALAGVVTPALLGLINDGDDEPAAMPDDAAVDITGNGFRCQITAGDIRKAAAALGDNP